MTTRDVTSPSSNTQAVQGQKPALAQSGDNSVQINQVATLNLFQMASGSGKEIAFPSCLSAECYHLIVGEVEYSNLHGSITLRSDRVLSTGSTVEQLVARFAALTREAIDELRTFPVLVAAENDNYGSASEEQIARIGFLTDVRILRSGIRVECFAIDTVPQQVINDLLKELDLWGNSRFNELNQTHWALKNVDLLGVLGAASAPMKGLAKALWGGRS